VSDKEGKRLIIAAELLDQEPLVLKLGERAKKLALQEHD